MTSKTKPTSFPREKIEVLLLEGIHPGAEELFTEEGFQVRRVKTSLSEKDLVEAVKTVHLLGIRSKTQVTDAVLKAAPRLLAVGCFCIGTNQVDTKAANLHGFPVFNAPFSNTRSVAELILAEIIALSRQLTDRSREVHEGTWTKEATHCHEVRGKTLGIVGYGHIGGQVGVLAEALGLHVIFYDVVPKLAIGNVKRCQSLEELLGKSDFVTLHVPDLPSTRGMISKKEIAKMKSGSYLLNASRGSVVDVKALAEALKSEKIQGAAVDVYPSEPSSNQEKFTSELQGLKNVILTPHVGGSTEEAQAAIGIEVATSLLRFTNSGSTEGAVNFPQIAAPPVPDSHRILNVHRNVPGVLRDINKVVSDLNANILGQVLSTDPEIGYLIMDIDQNVSASVKKEIQALPTSIRTRILY